MCVIFWLIGLVLSPVLSAAPEGCVAVPRQPCSYAATHPGGIAAVGEQWRVEIDRDGQTLSFTSGSAQMESDVIRPGDSVRAWAGIQVKGTVTDPPSSTAVVRVGSDAPSQNTEGEPK